MSDSPRYLRISQAADFLCVHPDTVRKWADSGILPSHRIPGEKGSGQRRFSITDLEEFIASRTTAVEASA